MNQYAANFVPPVHSLSSQLSRTALMRMTDAAILAVDCMRDLHTAGSNLVIEALAGADFIEWRHYPPNDVHDPASNAQYYFHAHPPDDRDVRDYGHFHTFVPSSRSVAGTNAATATEVSSPAGDAAVSHLIAISMTPSGMPERLFTTNRWVTGETWRSAADVIAALDEFTISINYPSPLINKWLTAMFVVFRPQIEALLTERDGAIAAWRARYPDSDVFEDRRLEITSSMEISLFRQLEWLDGQLASGRSRLINTRSSRKRVASRTQRQSGIQARMYSSK